MQNETLEEARLGTRAQHLQHADGGNSTQVFQAGTCCSPPSGALRMFPCLSNAALSCSVPNPFSSWAPDKGFGSAWFRVGQPTLSPAGTTKPRGGTSMPQLLQREVRWVRT